MDLQELRQEIDQIDAQLVSLMEARMDIATQVAQYKQENNLPILDQKREQEKIERLGAQIRPELAPNIKTIYELLFEQSRLHQQSMLKKHSPLYHSIQDAIQNTPKLFPETASVACQGRVGAYAQIATERLFSQARISYFQNFEGVFSAVESGLCPYGVLPIENSTAGSVTKIYDLMMQHNCHIVRSVRLKIDHCLLSLPEVALSEIREVISHEQALSQCTQYLSDLGIKVTAVENTALAAQMLQESGRRDLAAISSHNCAKLYGLSTLASDIQNQSNNYTRFICIAKNAEIYPGADRSSLLLVLPHKTGALYRILSHFAALGINLNKLESRPMPQRDFEFMFYFDLETSIYSERFALLLDSLQELCERFHYLGSYSEVI